MPGHKPPKRGKRPASADNFDNVPDFSDDATHVSPPHPLQRSAAKQTNAAAPVSGAKGKAATTGKKPSKPKWLHRVATSKKLAQDPALAGSALAMAAAGPQLDGQGLPYQTLAQLLKQHGLADTGGAAKHLVRAGGIAVNGEDELRPGRKLHHGDVVVIGDQTLEVVIHPA